MRTMMISRTVVLPDGKKRVFEHLKSMETLQNVSKPYASFERIEDAKEADGTDGPAKNEWQEAADYSFSLTVFKHFPIGLHRIHILRFDADEISTLEGNERVPIWNHRIILRPVTEESCVYTDELEIGAGFSTALVCLWAKLYLRHRQRQWVRLLRKEKQKTDSFG